jgi:hypothetical protein
VLSQSLTVWGPGNNYRIAYLHSGSVVQDGDSLLAFNNLPVTEYRLKNISNSGYDYQYLGYRNESYVDSVEIIVISLPNLGSFEFPRGGFPIILPLQFNGKNDWVTLFANSVQEKGEVIAESIDNEFFTSDVIISSNYVTFHTNSTLRNTSRMSDIYLPNIGRNLFNGTITRSNITAAIKYARSTGVLFSIETSLCSNSLDYNMSSYDSDVSVNQSLEFVAIIPPASLLRDAIGFNYWLLLLVVFIPLLRKPKIRR